jgi:hypothetical protein
MFYSERASSVQGESVERSPGNLTAYARGIQRWFKRRLIIIVGSQSDLYLRKRKNKIGALSLRCQLAGRGWSANKRIFTNLGVS